ncbi:MAG: phage major capsid protein [Bryobacterales bacterium]|nr:phage major capsid protein [Bryobacterales bacterium]
MTAQEVHQMQTAFAAFKTANDSAQAEFKALGRENAELKERIERIQNHLDEIEVKASRRGSFGDGSDIPSYGRNHSAHAKAFAAVLRGKADVTPEQYKLLHTGSDTAGGFLAPLEYVQDILKNIVEFSPIRSIASVRTTSRAGVQIPKRTTTAAAQWVEELGTRSETTNPAFGMAELRSHEAYALVKVSKAEVEDSAFDLEAFLRAEFAEQFGVAEGLSFVSGTGVGQPEGFMTNASVASVVSGSASAITADGLISLYFEPKSAYAEQAYWCLNRATLRAIRTLKDGAGQYLWQAGLQAATPRPATILDRPYVIAPDMPDIAANAYPVAFGDFRRGYTILDRTGVEVMVDNITSKATGSVEFSARKRVGGQVVIAEAIKKLKIST